MEWETERAGAGRAPAARDGLSALNVADLPPSRALSERLAVVCATDDGFACPTAVMAGSLVACANVGRSLDFYVLDGGMSPAVRQRLQRALDRSKRAGSRRGVDFRPVLITPDLKRIAGLGVKDHISPTTYLRLLAPDLLPRDLRRVLYLDGDILLLRDLEPLFTLKLVDAQGRTASTGGVLNASAGTVGRRMRHFAEFGLDPEAPYVNTGVLVIDLEAWRAQELGARVLEDLRQRLPLYRFHEQCALNAVLNGRWALAAWQWNVQCGATVVRAAPPALADVAALHFTSADKPWRPGYGLAEGHGPVLESYRQAWFVAARRSGWFGAAEWSRFRILLSGSEAAQRARAAARSFKDDARAAARPLLGRVDGAASPAGLDGSGDRTHRGANPL